LKGNPAPSSQTRGPGRVITLLVVLAAALILAWLAGRHARPESPAAAVPPAKSLPPPGEAELFGRYAGSAACRECHTNAFQRWQDSHHALAERELDPARDRAAFDPPQVFRHGTQQSEARLAQGRYEMVTAGLDGKKPFTAVRVLGVDPLRQFLVAAPGNRCQVTEIAYHPASNDWFNVYGNEDRQPGEWGHWTGRGMTWNAMCATCHNTRLRKNYDPATDAYHTTRAEMGVGCEACHGPARAHVEWQRAHPPQPGISRPRDPTLPPLTKDQVLSVCGSCHTRRTDLTGNFQPGESFYDHFTPIIPDETDTYYPDGQVRDEDFEFVSFLGSRMYSLGVRCQDCHDVHSGKVLARGNDLCLRCHKTTIDPLAHGHHPLDKPGSKCLDCHMPITVYMARHPRHDHGFTIPDPRLTQERQIPNACTRCHADQPLEWSIAAAERWYGERLNRSTQQRARWLARARAGDHAAVAPLLRMMKEERIPMWRAIATGLLKRWAHEEQTLPALLAATTDRTPLVRGMAARVLELLSPQDHPAVASALKGLLADPLRAVRVEAAWALRRQVDTNSTAGRELLAHLAQGLDQPTGLLQQGVFFMDRGQPETALPFLERATAWDPRSAPLHQALAVCLSALGRKEEAASHLEKACALAPRDPDLRFNLGLARAELNQLDQAVSAFEQAVHLDAQFVRAWYNLGLARFSLGEPERALDALARAESADPASADAPYARATILEKIGRRKDARQAARRALEIEPGRPDAAQLLQALDGQP
jgi:predicted CXXCH cytochrome family protein